MKDAEISCVLIWDVCVCVSHAEGSYGGERAALLSSAWGSTADWRVKWSAAMLNCSPLSAVFSKHPPDDCGLCLPTWERHIFRRVCACSHTQPYPLPPHYRPHPLKHISDSRHCTSFLHSAHTHTLTRPRCKWNIYRSHASTRKHEHIYTQEHTYIHVHTHTHITCGRHTPQRLPVPSPQLNSLFWQSTGQPEHWRQRQAHENTGSLGGWGSYAHLHSLARN